MLLFENALLCDVDFVDGFGCRVVNLGSYCSLADAPTFFVDEFDKLVALVVRDLRVSLGHGYRYKAIDFV